jgi:hypothetical protein
MAKRTKAAAKKVAKKSANKSSKTGAKKAAAGHKRRKSRSNKSFFDHLISIFAGPDARKT